jgi:hypothetical protein
MPLFKPMLPPAVDVARRLATARFRLNAAEQAWAIAAATTESGADPASEAAAEKTLGSARRDVDRLVAVLKQCEAAEALAAGRAKAAREKAHDARVIAACRDQAKAAQEVEAAVGRYVETYHGLVAASENVRKAETGNRRVRRDLAISLPAAIAREITRIASGGLLPPGADKIAAIMLDPRQIPPLAAQFEAMADAILAP